MTKLEDLIRPNIRALLPYSSARDEFAGKEGTFLDANENPYGELNRYPDPHQHALKKELAAIKKLQPENIFIGNGSDEVFDLVFRIFCNPGRDKALIFTPTYGMYEVSAAINEVELVKLPLDRSFQLDLASIQSHFSDSKLKLIFICSPNNPTGNTMRIKDVQFILERFNGLVLVDEAYIDFAISESMLGWIEKYPNLVVSQTFSKAWGLAAARVGIAYANQEIIRLFNKVKPPYNVSEINQQAALEALRNTHIFEDRVKRILKEKERMIQALSKLNLIQKIYPSDANFLLVEVPNATKLYEDLIRRKIITRNRSTHVPNTLRITIGTPEENAALLNALKTCL
jgi:histidinol-phosphate aminotransferase